MCNSTLCAGITSTTCNIECSQLLKVVTSKYCLGYFQAPSGENASNVERCTFAMFMQPDWYVYFFTQNCKGGVLLLSCDCYLGLFLRVNSL
jgi:hypothetical protein